MMKISYIKKPKINIEIFDCSSEKESVWNIFKNHHYLTSNLNKSSRCFLACWNKVPVGFYAVLAMPSGTLKNAWRGHRLVVLSDYQGLGIGNRLSEWVANKLISEGKRFFAKTANIKLGEYRNKSSNWKKTSKNKKTRKNSELKNNYNNLINNNIFEKRVCYSHEYIGEK
jgi:GNAT superfamily N-acetyltransferase